MRSLITTLACAGALIFFTTAVSPCQAQRPFQSQRRCHVSGASGHGHVPHAGHVYLVPTPAHGGYATPLAKPAYAYGWFGVTKRRHKSVHYGYYNHRTDWTFR